MINDYHIMLYNKCNSSKISWPFNGQKKDIIMFLKDNLLKNNRKK